MTKTVRKATAATLAALTLSAALLAAAGSAEARSRFHRGHGIGLGIVGALAVGGLIAASQRHAYAEPAYGYAPVRECELVERLNRYGEVVGYRKVCSVY